MSFDLPKFLEALPVEEFTRLLESLDDRIEQRDSEAETAQSEAKRLRAQKGTIEQVLAAREQLIAAKERERLQITTDLPAAISPKRKRAAVLQVIEDHPLEPQTPASVRDHLARAGLIDPAKESGTPVRIILAQMREAGVLVKTGHGEYRLRTRDEQMAQAGSAQE